MIHAMPAIFLILACALWGLSFPLVKALHLEQSARLPEASSLFLAAWMNVIQIAQALGFNRPDTIGLLCRGDLFILDARPGGATLFRARIVVRQLDQDER